MEKLSSSIRRKTIHLKYEMWYVMKKTENENEKKSKKMHQRNPALIRNHKTEGQ